MLCDEDTIYLGQKGTLCCCNTDWCNRISDDEEESSYAVMKSLTSGYARDYDTLLSIAARYGVH